MVACRCTTATSFCDSLTLAAQLAACQTQKLFQIRAPRGALALLGEFREGEIHIARGRIAQPVAELRDPNAQRRHGISEVVQHPFGKFGKSGLERLIDELPARVRDTLDHPIELPCKHGNLVTPGNIQPSRQVRTLTDRHCVARHAGQGLENDAVERDDQKHQDRDRRADQVQRGIGHRALAALGDPTRHLDAKAHQRPVVDVQKGPGDLGRGVGLGDLLFAAGWSIGQHGEICLCLRADRLDLGRGEQPAHDDHPPRAARRRCRPARARRRSS